MGVDEVLRSVDHRRRRDERPRVGAGPATCGRPVGPRRRPTTTATRGSARTGRSPATPSWCRPCSRRARPSPLVVTLSHAYTFEAIRVLRHVLYDGGVIEITNDGGATWRDVTEFGVDPGYTGADLLDDRQPARRPRRVLRLSERVVPGARPAVAGLRHPVRRSAPSRSGSASAPTSRSARSAGRSTTSPSAGIDNTPFPGFANESATCSAGGATGDSGISLTRTGTFHSLDGVPGVDEDGGED